MLSLNEQCASFELEVLAPLDRRVISNTPVMMSNEETVVYPSGRKERRRRWKFAETPVMSTYLLALVRLRFCVGCTRQADRVTAVCVWGG